jgi:pyrophosphatase PpaX
MAQHAYDIDSAPATRSDYAAPASSPHGLGIEAVLFDFDGTLVDTVDLILDSFRYATRTVFGQALPDEELMRHVGKPLAYQMRDFTDDEEVAADLLRVYRAYNAEQHDHKARLYPGTVQTLARLAEREMPMAVVTSKGRVMADRGMSLFGLEEYVSLVVTADDTDRHKPDPCPLIHAAELLGVDIARCVYLGDSPHDMSAAIAAGAVPVAALWGAFERDDVLRPDPPFALTRIEDLPEFLDGDRGRFATGLV